MDTYALLILDKWTGYRANGQDRSGHSAESGRAAGSVERELADTASLSLRTVQKIEAGHSSPRGLTVEKLAAVFKVPEDELDGARYDRGEDRASQIISAGKSSRIEEGSKPTTIHQMDHLLIGESEILKWVAQTARIASMINRHDVMYTLMETVLAGAWTAGRGSCRGRK